MTPSKATTSARATALFALLYAVQGVVVAYLTNFNKGYMVAAGVDERIAARVETLALSLLMFKFVLGPVSDRWSPFGLGHRRPYIILGLMLLILGLFGLSALDPGVTLFGFGAAAVVAVGGMCLFDTTCDGMVIDVTPPNDRSRVQGLLQLSRFLATMVCTLGFGFWIEHHGPGPGRSDAVILACAAFAMVPLALAFFVRERSTGAASDRERFDWAAMKVMFTPYSLILIAYGALYGLVGVGVEFNLNRWYAALGYGNDANGVFSAIRYGGRAAGAIALPILGARMTRSRRIALGLIVLAAATILQAAVVDSVSAGATAFLFGLANGWNDALFCVLAMEAANPLMAASTFAIFMAASNVSIVGDFLFLEVVHLFGGRFAPAFAICAALVLGLVGFVRPLSRPPHRAATSDAEGAAA
ncbi:MAG: MFS transporter [Isosphaeraceae bacterium]|nr:MFS transporter [Isosphaeraceae bacterium]